MSISPLDNLRLIFGHTLSNVLESNLGSLTISLGKKLLLCQTPKIYLNFFSLIFGQPIATVKKGNPIGKVQKKVGVILSGGPVTRRLYEKI